MTGEAAMNRLMSPLSSHGTHVYVLLQRSVFVRRRQSQDVKTGTKHTPNLGLVSDWLNWRDGSQARSGPNINDSWLVNCWILLPMTTAMDARVQDYLDDKLQSAADLDSLDSLLENVREQQELLKKQVRSLNVIHVMCSGITLLPA